MKKNESNKLSELLSKLQAAYMTPSAKKASKKATPKKTDQADRELEDQLRQVLGEVSKAEQTPKKEKKPSAERTRDVKAPTPQEDVKRDRHALDPEIEENLRQAMLDVTPTPQPDSKKTSKKPKKDAVVKDSEKQTAAPFEQNGTALETVGKAMEEAVEKAVEAAVEETVEAVALAEHETESVEVLDEALTAETDEAPSEESVEKIVETSVEPIEDNVKECAEDADAEVAVTSPVTEQVEEIPTPRKSRARSKAKEKAKADAPTPRKSKKKAERDEEIAPVEHIVEKVVADELIEEIVEEVAADEPIEEIVEEVAADELIEEIVEEVAVDELIEEIVEEVAADELIEEVIEEVVADEPIEEVIEEVAANEPIEEVAAEKTVKKTVAETPNTAFKKPSASPIRIVPKNVRQDTEDPSKPSDKATESKISDAPIVIPPPVRRVTFKSRAENDAIVIRPSKSAKEARQNPIVIRPRKDEPLPPPTPIEPPTQKSQEPIRIKAKVDLDMNNNVQTPKQHTDEQATSAPKRAPEVTMVPHDSPFAHKPTPPSSAAQAPRTAPKVRQAENTNANTNTNTNTRTATGVKRPVAKVTPNGSVYDFQPANGEEAPVSAPPQKQPAAPVRKTVLGTSPLAARTASEALRIKKKAPHAPARPSVQDANLDEIADQAVPKELSAYEVSAPNEPSRESNDVDMIYRELESKHHLTVDDVNMLFELDYEFELERLIGYRKLKKLKSDYVRRMAAQYRSPMLDRHSRKLEKRMQNAIRAHEKRHAKRVKRVQLFDEQCARISALECERRAELDREINTERARQRMNTDLTQPLDYTKELALLEEKQQSLNKEMKAVSELQKECNDWIKQYINKLKEEFKRGKAKRAKRAQKYQRLQNEHKEYCAEQEKGRILSLFKKNRRYLYVRTAITAVVTLLLFFLDMPQLIGAAFVAFLSSHSFLTPAVGLFLLGVCVGMSHRQFRSGMLRFLEFRPTPYSVCAVLTPFALAYGILSFFMPLPSLWAVTAMTFLVTALCDVLRVNGELRSFSIVSKAGSKIVFISFKSTIGKYMEQPVYSFNLTFYLTAFFFCYENSWHRK